MKKVYKIPVWEKYENLICSYSTKALGNTSFRTGYDETVEANRKTLVNELGITWNDVLILPLSHSNHVLSLPNTSLITKDTNGVYMSGGHMYSTKKAPVHDNPEWQSGIDAVVTNIRGLFPIIMSADCGVVGFLDRNQNVFAMVHAGLIGAVNQIVSETVKCLTEEYHSDVKNIQAAIFPSIRKCHYDLQLSGAWNRIKRDCLAYYGQLDPIFLDEKFDLQGLLQRQMIASGIEERNIYDIGLCTVCNLDKFFSNLAAKSPRQKKIEGRFASIMGVMNET